MKSRKLSTLVMVLLIAVLCGVGGYVVYAAINVSLNATNRIIFNADPDKLFYVANVTVKYQGEDTIIAESKLDHSGDNSASGSYSQDKSKTEIAFNDAISFTNDHKVLVYEITIANHTQQDIQVEIVQPDDSYYFTNVLDKTTATLTKFETGKTISTTTFTLTTTMISSQFSFKFDNSFSINLSIGNPI